MRALPVTVVTARVSAERFMKRCLFPGTGGFRARGDLRGSMANSVTGARFTGCSRALAHAADRELEGVSSALECLAKNAGPRS